MGDIRKHTRKKDVDLQFMEIRLLGEPAFDTNVPKLNSRLSLHVLFCAGGNLPHDVERGQANGFPRVTEMISARSHGIERIAHAAVETV